MSIQLSEHFTLEEFCRSEKATSLGINNTPPVELVSCLSTTAQHMETVREILGVPVHIDSAYRCLELNSALKSKPTSDHIRGWAVDFIAPKFGTPLEICKTLIHYKDQVNFNKLILEHTWIHIAWDQTPGAKQRNIVLSLLLTGNYAEGLTDASGKVLT